MKVDQKGHTTTLRR